MALHLEKDNNCKSGPNSFKNVCCKPSGLRLVLARKNIRDRMFSTIRKCTHCLGSRVVTVVGVPVHRWQRGEGWLLRRTRQKASALWSRKCLAR